MKRTTTQDGGGEAGLAFDREADDEDDGGHQPDAAEAGAGDDAHRPLALAVGEFLLGAARRRPSGPALESQTAAPTA